LDSSHICNSIKHSCDLDHIEADDSPSKKGAIFKTVPQQPQVNI